MDSATADNVGPRVIAEAANNFTGAFAKTVSEGNPDNLVTSPWSLLAVLAMAAYGARGRTASQMRSILSIPEDDAIGYSGFNSIIDTLNRVGNVELTTANKIFVDTGFPIKPEYKAVTTTRFRSSIQELNFTKSPVASANAINSWCEEQTHNRIKDVVSEDDFDGSIQLFLVNAVYFKGKWLKPFHPFQSQERRFFTDATNHIDVPMMSIRDEYLHGSLPELNSRFVELLYEGSEMSMILILPNEKTGLDGVVDGLRSMSLTDILENGTMDELDLFVPKFKIETTLHLRETLEKMGMVEMFTPGSADFSGISDQPLVISKVIQKAFIEVNEEGSEAAAFSAVGIALASADWRGPEEFLFDRPFKYFICHRKNVAFPLFEGVVRRPAYN